MKIFENLNEWISFRKAITNKTIGFVPTMGNLHQGHKSLLLRSVEENDISILSIYINPTQFQNKNDLEKYPKTYEEDIKIAKQAGIDFIIMPTYEQIYPDHYTYKMTNNSELSTIMEGRTRPGFFDGMLTVVLKLLMIAKANKAYFGEKDYQQLCLVKDMAAAFFLDTEIIPCPTIRNENGFALSSRNNRLNKQQLELAQNFPKLLHSDKTCDEIKRCLENLNIKVNYIQEYKNRRLGSVVIGNINLIDNGSIEN